MEEFLSYWFCTTSNYFSNKLRLFEIDLFKIVDINIILSDQ